MKSTPLLFTPANAQKSHDGRKVETRRLNGLDDINQDPGSWRLARVGAIDPRWGACFVKHGQITETFVPCPYGGPGDRLWVREAWRPGGEYAELATSQLRGSLATRDSIHYRGEPFSESIDRWRPSIHMPKWACRTWLELTEVRVEQLGDISEDDAVAEGVKSVAEFIELWKSIKKTWEPELWTWALTYKRVEP